MISCEICRQVSQGYAQTETNFYPTRYGEICKTCHYQTEIWFCRECSTSEKTHVVFIQELKEIHYKQEHGSVDIA